MDGNGSKQLEEILFKTLTVMEMQTEQSRIMQSTIAEMGESIKVLHERVKALEKFLK